MAVQTNKRRVIVLGSYFTRTYLLNIIINMKSYSKNEEKLVQEFMNVERNMKIRDKVRKTVCIEGYVKNTVQRFPGK